MSTRRGTWAIVLLITLVGVVVFAIALALHGPRPQPSAPSVLVWNVPEVLVEGEPPHRLFGYGWLRRTRPSVLDAVRSLDRAATDHRVKALVLHIDGLDWGWGKLSEIRDAVARLRKFGKPVYAVIESGGDAEYFLASAANVVAVPPAAVLQINGLMASAMFFRGTFDKLDVHPNFVHAGEYKSAAESYTRTGLSQPAREALNALLDDLFTVLVDSLASARGIERDSVRRLIDDGPFPATAAHAVGLADTVLYAEQVDSLAVHREEDGVETQSFNRYMNRAPWHDSKVAFVSAVGTIASGRSRYEPVDGMVMGSETMIEALRSAREDDAVKAVVLRVDSPGGDAVAADEIWHEVQRLNARKPVIVSMSDLAASGGYYISAPATRIVAQPGTLTGSIGVYAGKLNILGLYHKLGLNVETLSRGRNAEMLSAIRDFTPEESARFQAQVDSTYRLFLRRVSRGRSISLERADAVGRGRVWTGEAALTRSLVDTLGGIRTAWRLALRSAGLPSEQRLEVEEYPHPSRTFFDRMLDAWLSDENPSDDVMARGMTPVMRAWLAAAAFPAGRVLALLPWSITIR